MDSHCLLTKNNAVQQVSEVHNIQQVDSGPVKGEKTLVFPINKCNMFMTGYSECAEEAIRFLMEEEGLPCSHPLVIELYNHLDDHQKLLHIQYLLKSTLLQGDHETNGEVKNEADDDQHPPSDVTEEYGEALGDAKKRAANIVKTLFCLLQDDFSDEEDVEDEGFADCNGCWRRTLHNISNGVFSQGADLIKINMRQFGCHLVVGGGTIFKF